MSSLDTAKAFPSVLSVLTLFMVFFIEQKSTVLLKSNPPVFFFFFLPYSLYSQSPESGSLSAPQSFLSVVYPQKPVYMAFEDMTFLSFSPMTWRRLDSWCLCLASPMEENCEKIDVRSFL